MTPVRLLVSLLFCSITISATAADTAATVAARDVLAVQRDAWNRADIDAFMRGYWHSDEIRFAGGGDFRYGWDATIARYRASYPDAATMGTLDFDLVEVRELAPAVVYVFGKWHLTRANDDPESVPHGLFTFGIARGKRGHFAAPFVQKCQRHMAQAADADHADAVGRLQVI